MAGLVISTDLLFADSLCQRARMLGKKLEMRSLPATSEYPEPSEVTILLVDLSSLSANIEEAIATLKSNFPAAKITAFGPHVHEAVLQSAAAAGCDEVITRGQMHQQAQRYINQL